MSAEEPPSKEERDTLVGSVMKIAKSQEIVIVKEMGTRGGLKVTNPKGRLMGEYMAEELIQDEETQALAEHPEFKAQIKKNLESVPEPVSEARLNAERERCELERRVGRANDAQDAMRSGNAPDAYEDSSSDSDSDY
eukprot:gnl/TRDRNA2_/TRDRNA2_86696_c0_seq1.p1 gnl/TRDRNA2_/TRDRNA2_86696_c0~~gnl/TRDRNA2_/TRDRNA2_86696_c0_seq1.p1  ORF type:complete len:137 (+),score=28.55 gnl/TRDRNA2_/TRDRNA2_86696_c0_seq1:108-518(+)